MPSGWSLVKRQARRAGFVRDVAVAPGNWGSPDAVPAVVCALRDAEPLVRWQAACAPGLVQSAEDRQMLISALERESDALVREELDVASGNFESSNEQEGSPSAAQ